MNVSQIREHWMNKSTRQRNSIRVLLVDQSILTLQGLKTILAKRSHIEVVGVAHTAAKALSAINAYRPDVAMLEVRAENDSGIDLCKKIREAHPNIGVLFF